MRINNMPPVSDSHPLPLDKEALELPEGKFWNLSSYISVIDEV